MVVSMIQVRAATLADAEALVRIYNPYVLNTTISYETQPVTAEVFRGRMAQIMEEHPYLVAEENGVLLGFAYASEFKTRAAYHWDVELSIYVDESCRGRGIGTLFMESLIKVLKSMNYVNLYSLIDYPNEGSMALHKRFQFHKVGILKGTGYKLGHWLDVMILEKRINEEPAQLRLNWRKML